ncbi:MAG: hypothetical protein ABIG92_05900 [Candidatus Omnitrophota bacterium]
MKKIILVVFSLFLSGRIAYAHPPSDIEAVYDRETKSLNVTVYHDVRTPERHFVESVSIKLNDKDLIVREFKSQTNESTQKFGIPVENDGLDNAVTIEAFCNLSGDLEKTIVVKNSLQ